MNLRGTLTLAVGLFLACLAPGRPMLDRTVMNGTGRSMLPTLPEECRLIVVRIPFDEIKIGVTDGDIVATRVNGGRVVHRAIRRLPDGSLVTQGDHNARPDAVATTELNYVGIVVGFEKAGTTGELAVPSNRPADAG